VGITSLQDMVNKQAGQKKSSLEEFRFLKVRISWAPRLFEVID
jgi:hypothetical protein